MSFKGDGIGKKVSGGVYPLEILLSVCISPVRNVISKGAGDISNGREISNEV
jgi:hypothetical protein